MKQVPCRGLVTEVLSCREILISLHRYNLPFSVRERLQFLRSRYRWNFTRSPPVFSPWLTASGKFFPSLLCVILFRHRCHSNIWASNWFRLPLLAPVSVPRLSALEMGGAESYSAASADLTDSANCIIFSRARTRKRRASLSRNFSLAVVQYCEWLIGSAISVLRSCRPICTVAGSWDHLALSRNCLLRRGKEDCCSSSVHVVPHNQTSSRRSGILILTKFKLNFTFMTYFHRFLSVGPPVTI